MQRKMMNKINRATQATLLFELGELYTQVLQTNLAWETRIALIKAAIESETYIIQADKIIHRMLEHHDVETHDRSHSTEILA